MTIEQLLGLIREQMKWTPTADKYPDCDGRYWGIVKDYSGNEIWRVEEVLFERGYFWRNFVEERVVVTYWQEIVRLPDPIISKDIYPGLSALWEETRNDILRKIGRLPHLPEP